MIIHLNRSARSPRPEEIRAARKAAGLTQSQAAAMVYVTLRAWQTWEGGKRRMHPAIWELWQSKVKSKSTT